MVRTIMASLYTVLALVALVLALAWFRQDPLGCVFVVVLGLAWTFFLSAAVDGAVNAPRQAPGPVPSSPRCAASSAGGKQGRPRSRTDSGYRDNDAKSGEPRKCGC
jgi:hypothetical protein